LNPVKFKDAGSRLNLFSSENFASGVYYGQQKRRPDAIRSPVGVTAGAYFFSAGCSAFLGLHLVQVLPSFLAVTQQGCVQSLPAALAFSQQVFVSAAKVVPAILCSSLFEVVT